MGVSWQITPLALIKTVTFRRRTPSDKAEFIGASC
jgi:hypothetical protein